MAVLSDADRAALWAEFQADCSRGREPLPLSKTDLRAAVDAIDAWLNTNASGLNTAIPQPARGALTAAQKAKLLKFVVTKRYLTGA